MAFIDTCVAVIVNLNLKMDTADCIRSLVRAGIELKRVIVVDNGSTDGSLAYLREQFGADLVLIDAVENRGYAAGLNLGIKKGLEAGAGWFFLMNNDTVVDESFFERLGAAVEAHPEAALFGPLILYYSEPTKIWYLGDTLIPGTLITRNPYRGKIDRGNLPETVPVDFVHGCGMLVSRAVFERIGNFDDWSIIYAEEVDFIWRARRAGFKALGVPGARMWHKISTIMGKQKPRTRYLRVRNQIRFYRRYAAGLSLVVMFFFTILRCTSLAAADLFKRQFDLLGPLCRGWFEGWFGRQVRDVG